MAITATASTYQVAAQSVQSSASLSDQVRRRPDPSAILTISVGRSHTKPRSPEHFLWSTILLDIHADIAEHGPTGKAYKSALANLENLEYVTGCLGYPKGAAQTLLTNALGVWERRKLLIRDELQAGITKESVFEAAS